MIEAHAPAVGFEPGFGCGAGFGFGLPSGTGAGLLGGAGVGEGFGCGVGLGCGLGFIPTSYSRTAPTFRSWTSGRGSRSLARGVQLDVPAPDAYRIRRTRIRMRMITRST